MEKKSSELLMLISNENILRTVFNELYAAFLIAVLFVFKSKESGSN
jgi:hypothetical protein